MFGFGTSEKKPLADIKSAETWLATLPSNDPLAMHAEVVAQLRSAAAPPAPQAALRQSGLEAIFRVDTRTAGLRGVLTSQYIEHAIRSSRIENQLWQALFDLSQGFLQCYQAYGREIAQNPRNGKWQALLPELVARQIVHLGLDAKCRLFHYEQWIPARWAELHALFTLACAQQIERRPAVLGGDGRVTTIEQEYLVTTVLQLMNTGNLSARNLDWLMRQLDDWCVPLRLTLESSAGKSFYVDLARRTGLRRRPSGPLEGRVLFLDTRPLHSSLRQHIVVLEQKIQGEPVSDRAARYSEQRNLLTKLAAQVDPDYRPIPRRGERRAAAGTVDAIVGFTKISGYLREEQSSPIPEENNPGKSFGGTLELAVFGRNRGAPVDRRAELTRRRLAAFAAPGGAWEVKDVSQTGFRLLAPMNVAAGVTLGALVALRPAGQSEWTLGIVRRMQRLTADRAEIGLQVIANTLVGVQLHEQRKPSDADYSIDGEQSTFGGRGFHGLFLALRARPGGGVVQSLIVPPAEFKPNKRVQLETAQQSMAVRFGHVLEQQPDWVWAAIESIDVGSGIAPSAAPTG
jgi:cyclic-di-GMP-binding protein